MSRKNRIKRKKSEKLEMEEHISEKKTVEMKENLAWKYQRW